MTTRDVEPEERWVRVPGGRVWSIRHRNDRSVSQPKQTDTGSPLLVLHGGPGLPSDYLHGLAALAHEFGVDVVFFDQLGCGRSERPDDPGLWTVSRAVAEVEAVRVALDLGQVHLLGHSWGAYLALAYVAEYPKSAVSLVMSSPLVSVPQWLADTAVLVETMPSEERDAIRRHETAGTFADPEYVAATDLFYRRHLCSLDPWPDSLVRTFEQMGQQTYEVMWGPSEFTATGTLRGGDLSSRLPVTVLPSLWLGGTRDEVRPSTLQSFAAAAGGEVLILLNGTHCLHLEQPEAYLNAVGAFLTRQQQA